MLGAIWVIRPSTPLDICLAISAVFRQKDVMVPSEKFVVGPDDKKYFYDRSMPLVFIGGMPRSGTTLLRALLDAHPDVRCGEETRVIPRLLGLKSQWLKSNIELRRLKEAGVSPQVLDSAIAAFILEIIARHGPPATRLCNKDPFTLRSAVYLRSLFPKAKFILLLRDGRAVVHSIITRKVTITGMDLHDYRQCLRRWSTAVRAMYGQCHLLGPGVCHPVHYERLVLHPEATMRDILEFLDLPWNRSVLHHERLIGKPGGVSLSMLERSTDQVIKPINTIALTKWVGKLPQDVIRDMPSLAPMLHILGYDPHANPPDYGKPDALVIQNTWELKVNKQAWDEREKLLAEKRDSIWKSWLHKGKVKNRPSTISGSTSRNYQNRSSTSWGRTVVNRTDLQKHERGL
ncbi:protein-tyrosine sulfotransferase 1-like [Uloborus diversus]|uniref:protein-tyrosine sulfotransferase 1-like n=1 Tax=Uloborus diversus TaxID=327109 RepID=UPI0024095FCB|nr:protein-tyrosine sulfotransferase 1-like [Uloborus diversus]